MAQRRLSAEAVAPPVDVNEAKSDASAAATVFNMINNVVGAGLLSLPWTLKRASLIPGLLAMAFVGVMNAVSVVVISRCCDIAQTYNYREMGKKAAGGTMGIIVQVVTGCYTLGSCISYVVLVGDFIPPVLQDLTGDEHAWFTQRWFTVVVTAAVIFLPLSMLKNLSRMQYTSILGLVGIAYASVILIARVVTGPRPGAETVDVIGWRSGLWAAFPITNVSFTLHYNCPRYFQELRDRSLKKMAVVTAVSFGVCLMVYAATAASGYSTFGAETKGDILENFAGGNTKAIVGRFALAFVVVFTYPLALHPLRSVILNILPSRLGSFETSRLFFPITILMVILTSIVGILVPHVEVILGYKGALFGCNIVYILPAIMYFSLVEQSRLRDRLFGSASAKIVLSTNGLGPAASSRTTNPAEEHLLADSHYSNGSTSMELPHDDAPDGYEGFARAVGWLWGSSLYRGEMEAEEVSVADDASAHMLPDKSRGPLLCGWKWWRRAGGLLCCTRHGFLATFFIVWGSVVLVLGVLVTSNVNL